MKICTIGNGFVASHLNYELIDSRLSTDSKQIEDVLDKYKPDVLVNCIGKTGRPNIDWCESHKEETAATNLALPVLLAQECAKKSIHLIQIGSGCIYFGESPNAGNKHTPENMKMKPPEVSMAEWSKLYIENGQYKKDEWTWIEPGWKETDFANPGSFYSKTKFACDLALGDMDNVTTLRIRMPISPKRDPRNIISKLIGYSQIIDIKNSMTFMPDLVRCIDWVAKNHQTGIFHVTNPQPITAAEIMTEYQKYVPSHKFSIIDEQQLGKLTVSRRSNCLLNTDKLNSKGFFMTNSKEAVRFSVSEYTKTI